jgi:hypothetical protein
MFAVVPPLAADAKDSGSGAQQRRKGHARMREAVRDEEAAAQYGDAADDGAGAGRR